MPSMENDVVAVEHIYGARAAVRPQRSQRRAPTQQPRPSQCLTLSRRVVVQDSGTSEQSHTHSSFFPGSPRLTLGMGPTHIPNTRWSSTGQTVVEQGHKESEDLDKISILRCEFTADSPKCRIACGGPAVRRSREISSGTGRRTVGQTDRRL